MSSTLAEHRTYLADEPRLAAYRQALSQLVKPGDVVLDLGTGTGVLGLLAIEAGAGRVYSVDATEMLGLAGAVIRANGASDKITLIKGHSRAIDLPEKADVVVADQLGPWGIEADALGAYRDAVRRHTKPDPRLIPAQVTMQVAPVRAPDVWEEVSFWDAPANGVDITAIASHARNARYYLAAEPDDVLGDVADLAVLDLATHDNAPIRGEVSMAVTKAGTLHGLAGFFTAELAPGIAITNSPLGNPRLDRGHLLLPVAKPVEVQPGDTITAHLHVVPPDQLARWTIIVVGADGKERARSGHSTLDLSVLSKEDLARTRPDFKPKLGPRGEARRTLLSLMDGTTRLDELEEAVWERHREIFDDRAAAAAFVGQLVAREVS